jgi:hypothetical protein
MFEKCAKNALRPPGQRKQECSKNVKFLVKAVTNVQKMCKKCWIFSCFLTFSLRTIRDLCQKHLKSACNVRKMFEKCQIYLAMWEKCSKNEANVRKMSENVAFFTVFRSICLWILKKTLIFLWKAVPIAWIPWTNGPNGIGLT